MKNVICFILVFVTGLGMFAQKPADSIQVKTGRKKMLEFSAGYSVAFGAYASVDKSDKKSGYASNGWLLQLNYASIGPYNVGFAFQYTYQNNKLNSSASQIRPNGWSSGTLGPGSWSNHYLMVGPVYNATFKKINVDARILGGLIVSSSANFTTQDPTDTTGMKRDANLAGGFGYGISAGVGYAVSSHLILKINVSLMGGWPMKNREYASQWIGTATYIDPVTGIKYYKPIYSSAVEYDINKVVTTFNPLFGIIYRF
jgi:hypothetical protein